MNCDVIRCPNCKKPHRLGDLILADEGVRCRDCLYASDVEEAIDRIIERASR